MAATAIGHRRATGAAVGAARRRRSLGRWCMRPSTVRTRMAAPAHRPLHRLVSQGPRLPPRGEAAGRARPPGDVGKPARRRLAAREPRRHLLRRRRREALAARRPDPRASATWRVACRIDRIVPLDDFDWRRRPRCASTCACRAWARPRRATSATSWRCACGRRGRACSCRPSCTSSTTTRCAPSGRACRGPWLRQAAPRGVATSASRKSSARGRPVADGRRAGRPGLVPPARAVRARRGLSRGLASSTSARSSPR